MLSSNPITSDLIKARELIADEKNWCTERFNIGNRYCARGAILRVIGVEEGELAWPLLINEKVMEFKILDDCLSKAAGELAVENKWSLPDIYNPAYVNNELGHAAVMQMYDRAIENSLVTV